MSDWQKTYDVDLRGIDVTDFERNPVVFRDWSYDLGAVIGAARILRQKRKVMVRFMGHPPEYEHTLGCATCTMSDGTTKLVALAVIPVLREVV